MAPSPRQSEGACNSVLGRCRDLLDNRQVPPHVSISPRSTIDLPSREDAYVKAVCFTGCAEHELVAKALF